MKIYIKININTANIAMGGLNYIAPHMRTNFES